MRVTVRAGALQRQLAVRKLRVVMEVEEKRAAAVMLLPTRAPMRVRSLEMEEMTVLVVSHPRETKERQREEMKERKITYAQAEQHIRVGKYDFYLTMAAI